MAERDAFLAAIIEQPDDDAPRLIYADWLEEHGEAERAEFIRLQIRLAQTECCPLCTLDMCVCNRHNWKMREREIKHKWFARRLSEGGFEDWENYACCEYRRGFVTEITAISCEDWLRFREQILRTTPLEKVTLTHWRLAYGLEQYFTPGLVSLVPLSRGERFIHEPWCFDVRDGKLFASWGDPVHLFTLEEHHVLFGDSAAVPPLGTIHAPTRRR